MTAIIFDTETTSRDDDREIIEAAWYRPISVLDLAGPSEAIPHPLFADGSERFEQRYKSTKPIDHGAMAVHHILPGELEGCPHSSTFSLPNDVEYLVAHNVDFDWEAAGSPPGIKRICTFAMSNWLWPEADSHSQSALLYMLLGPTPETRELLKGAHGAMTDVLNNVRLLERILEAKPEITTWSQLYEYSEACRVPRVMPIGEKQGVKGLTLDEAVEYDYGFVQWALRQDWLDDYLRLGLEQAIERYNNPPPPAPDSRPICNLDPACVLVAGHEGDCDHIPF